MSDAPEDLEGDEVEVDPLRGALPLSWKRTWVDNRPAHYGVAGEGLPVVFLHDTVVLPGMVVPIELDDQARAAIDAARLAHDASQKSDAADDEPTRVLVAPRLEDRYATHGVVAVVDRVGRFAGGRPAAVLRAERPGLHMLEMPHPSPTFVCTSPDVPRRIVAALRAAAAFASARELAA